MGLFKRRQGHLETMAALADFAPDDRGRGLDLLQDAEKVFVGIAAPSRLGVALFSVALSGLGISVNDDAYGAYVGVMLMGYACRMGQPEPPVPDDEVGRISEHLYRLEDGHLAYNALSNDLDAVERIADYVVSLDARRLTRLAGTSPEGWIVFCRMASMQLHRNLVRNGMRDRELPDPETMIRQLGYGYVTRFVDEVAGEKPLAKADLG